MTPLGLAQRSALSLGLAVLAVAGCSKKEGNVATSSGSIGTSTGAATTSVRVADVNLGTGIGTDKHVTGQTESFKPNDTIYASVHTTGSASNATLTARWTFQDGQNVDERSETISPSGDTYTEFHVSKPGGWPAGNYTLHLLLNGQEIATKNFSVSR